MLAGAACIRRRAALMPHACADTCAAISERLVLCHTHQRFRDELRHRRLASSYNEHFPRPFFALLRLAPKPPHRCFIALAAVPRASSRFPVMSPLHRAAHVYFSSCPRRLRRFPDALCLRRRARSNASQPDNIYRLIPYFGGRHLKFITARRVIDEMERGL